VEADLPKAAGRPLVPQEGVVGGVVAGILFPPSILASAAALVFTLPKDDMQKGASRCLSQMGIFRGDDVKSRYRRLDMNCSRTKTDISIAISRRRDE